MSVRESFFQKIRLLCVKGRGVVLKCYYRDLYICIKVFMVKNIYVIVYVEIGLF